MGLQIKKVNFENGSMNYFEFGNGGKNLVILPGLSIQSVMNSADIVAHDYKMFSQDFRLFVFDRKDDLPENYSVYDMAEDTTKAIIALGLDSLYLFGASQGGMMAASIALNYPELVKKLAICSSAFKIDGDRFNVISDWIDFAGNKDGVSLYLDFGKKLYSEEFFATYKTAFIRAGESVKDEEFDRFAILAKGTEGFDISGGISDLTCPVFAAGATDDAVLGADAIDEVERLLNNLPEKVIHKYSGYGHACFDTAPDYKDRLFRFFTDFD